MSAWGVGSPGEQPPRFSGIRTFARRPHRTDPAGADVAVCGAPFDTGTSYRAGPRFGPEAIRSASALLRDYHPSHRVDVLGTLEVVDLGDFPLVPGNKERSLELITEALGEVIAAGATALVLGGDHLVTLAELRALAAAHGPLGLVLLDAHADTWDSYYGERYFHGTPFRRAAEEGIVAPERSLMAGMRGPLYSASDLDDARELGFQLILGEELRDLSAAEYGERARARAGGDPAFLSFDIDFVDPAFAPGTGTPEVGGPTSAEALGYVHALTEVDFRGFDVVEVSPPYDNPGQTTALLAANVAYEMLALAALSG